MARMWIVLGDATDSGGQVVTASPYTDIDGKAVARYKDKATCPTHQGVFAIVGGCDPTHIIDGEPVALHGATLECGCRVIAARQVRVLVDAGQQAADTHASAAGAAMSAGSHSNTALLSDPTSLDATAGISRASAREKNDNCETKFRKVSRIVLANEGGFVDDPDDAGGATNMGIAWPTWQAYAMLDLGVEPTLDNLRNLTAEQAEVIYRKRYWEPRGFCKLDDARVA